MRKSGILLHISSLPSGTGIGTLGEQARQFVDFLAEAGQAYWQVLPIGPTGYADSPYQSFSAFASNPYFIDLKELEKDGLLKAEEIDSVLWEEDPHITDFGLLYQRRFPVLESAVGRFSDDHPEYLEYIRENEDWIEDFSLFMALKKEHNDVSFQLWPDAFRLRDPETIQHAKEHLGSSIRFWKVTQYLFYRQWKNLKAYANENGISLIGDIPIYISPDSSDLWAHKELFQVNENGCPDPVAGCPPDAFSDDGQLWGNPLYLWDAHIKTNFEWWIRRLRRASFFFDCIRIDHFRGFASYYAIPASEETAKSGDWIPGPGPDFIRKIKKDLPDLQIIAEDLGYLTPDVRELLKESCFPGMKVLQFAFSPEGDNEYLPHNHIQNAIVYTGTHDNPTTVEWEGIELPENIAFAHKYLAISEEQPLTDAMIRAALSSVCNTCILPLQDYLQLDEKARMNTPSTVNGNWRWRVTKEQLTPDLAEYIRELSLLYRR